jgi:hypothetical protein
MCFVKCVVRFYLFSVYSNPGRAGSAVATSVSVAAGSTPCVRKASLTAPLSKVKIFYVTATFLYAGSKKTLVLVVML